MIEQIEQIEHTRTQVMHPQTNGICERFHKTVLNEFYRAAFRRKFYRNLEVLLHDLDAFLDHYNAERPHQGRCATARPQCRRFWTVS